jgi:hypothetical protein
MLTFRQRTGFSLSDEVFAPKIESAHRLLSGAKRIVLAVRCYL